MDAARPPGGRDDRQIYLIRRALVLGAVVALALLIWLVAWLVGRDSSTADAPVVASPATSPASTPADTATSAAVSASPSGKASQAPSKLVTPTSSPSAKASAGPSKAGSSSPTSTPSQSEPVGCDPAELTLKVSGASTVTSGKKIDLTVTATSKGAPCRLDLKQNPFELKIYSGTDRIWSTADCAKWAPASPMVVGERGWSWKQTWSTQRSSSGCTLSDEYLRPGTYVATATISGSRPAQLVMRLVG